MGTPELRIVHGEKIYHNDNHHPDRVTGTIWYRHDKVFVGDRELKGFIQVKYFRLRILGKDMKQNRTESLTCFPDGGCVRGSWPETLLKHQPEEKEAVQV